MTDTKSFEESRRDSIVKLLEFSLESYYKAVLSYKFFMKENGDIFDDNTDEMAKQLGELRKKGKELKKSEYSEVLANDIMTNEIEINKIESRLDFIEDCKKKIDGFKTSIKEWANHIEAIKKIIESPCQEIVEVTDDLDKLFSQ